MLLIAVLILIYYQTDVTDNLDTYTYELPYAKGTSHQVVQGYGGLFSHQYIAALDFEMPVGTPVYAARGGTIYSYRDNSDEGGLTASYKNKANYIIIQHDDGSFGCYWHLQKNGVLVRKGRVDRGQQIGLSGATGQVVRPHLHFSVKKKLTYDKDSFVQTRFRTSDGVLLLKNRASYERL
ncbi:MAG: M23 family metallopeptidase [Chitinophagaceae bacterium]